MAVIKGQIRINQKTAHFVSTYLIACLLQGITINAWAEVLRSQRRPDDLRRHIPETPLQRQQTDSLQLPTLPPITESKKLSSKTQLTLKQIILSGNTVFSDEVLAPIYKDYQGRVVNIEELLALKRQLTLYYVSRGYINSGALIPDQTVLDGVLKIRIIEGQLNQIKLANKTRLHPSYISNRLRLGNEQVLNINQLKNRVQLLYQDHLIERINANLVPSFKRGESILNVEIEESRPYELGVAFNNRRSPSVGSLHGELYGAVYNLTGYGDAFTARYGRTDGINSSSASYTIPFNRYDSRIGLFYDRSEADVIEDQFRSLNLRSETENYGISISHPLIQTPQNELLASLSLERRRSASTPPAASARGTDKGKSRVTALRISQSWLNRSPSQVFALRSAFNIGLGILGATEHAGDFPDGRFFSWLGQFQWVSKLFDSDNSVVIRSYLQLAAEPLLSLEKFGVGGQLTVRGYRENILVRDNAWVSSIEFRFPLIKLPIPGLSKSDEDGTLEFATFYDFAWAKNESFHDPSVNRIQQPAIIQTISSLGIGLRWQPHKKIQSQFYWGVPLRNVKTGGEHDLQDSGIHFLLNMQLL